MERLVIYIKTFRPDFSKVVNLLTSIEKYNRDHIPVYISVNDEDFVFFRRNLKGTFTLFKDADIIKCNVKDGWRLQAIVKPHFYRAGVCLNYLCVDSDAEFIRSFGYDDFMYDDTTPYTIMHEHKDFMDMLELLDMDSHNAFHIKALQSIRDVYGTHGKLWDYGPNPHLWSCRVWEHLIEVYLKDRNQTFESFYKELEQTALPHEAAIYGEYLLKTRLIDIVPVGGFFKVYHYKEQFEMEKPFYNVERLSKNYMGVIMQSNWTDENRNYERKKPGFLSRLFK